MKRILLLQSFFFLLFLSRLSAQQSELAVRDSAGYLIDSIYHELPEVMITGERPIVKVEEGKLIYDLPRLIADLPVDNVYDALKELPGVVETNGNITLVGQNVTVVINGKVTTLSSEQLNTLLKTIPAGRIEKAEVMYAAPAHYQVRGALINICLNQETSEEPSLQGELFTDYKQKYYEDLTGRASLFYSRSKFSADFLYSYNYGYSYFQTDKEALHTLSDGSRFDFNMHEKQRSLHHNHNVRVEADYAIAKDHQISFIYTGAFSNGHNSGTVEGSQTSDVYSRGSDQLHNGRIDYRTPFGMKTGIESTFYESPSTQLLHSRLNDEQLDFLSDNSQKINRWRAYVSKEHTLNKGWGINYGAIYTTSIDNSYQYYYDPENGELLPGDINMKSRRCEQTWNLYAGFNKSFGEKVSLDASLATEQFHTVMWNEWNWYPTLNLTYAPSASNVWQFAFSSDKSYPNYWAVQDAISYMGGGYSEIHGNPDLKPGVDYQVQLTNVLNSKYMLSAWYSYTKDNSMQALYQSPDRLVEIYKFLNFDFQQQAGLQAVIPFKINKWLNSRVTLIGVYLRQKDSDFWDIPFDRRVVYGMAAMNNTFTLSAKPDIKLTVSGMIRSKAIQGVYDLPASGNLDAALRYTFAKGKALLTLRCKDLFETSQITPQIRYATQNVVNHYASFREFGVSFAYKFGGYKEKQREAVDTSRFK